MLRVIIAGSRDFDDYALLQAHADYMLSRQEDIEIVSGGAMGAYVRTRICMVRVFALIPQMNRVYMT